MEVRDLNEVCKTLKITVQTGRNRISLGLPMPPSFKIGRRRLFLAQEINRWLETQAKTSSELCNVHDADANFDWADK